MSIGTLWTVATRVSSVKDVDPKGELANDTQIAVQTSYWRVRVSPQGGPPGTGNGLVAS